MLIETAYEKHRFMLCRRNVHQHAGARMKDAAQKKRRRHYQSRPGGEFEENIATADIVLLGPQVKYRPSYRRSPTH